MSLREFLVCAGGLSEDARWPRALAAIPVEADSPEAIASVFGTFLGEPLIDN